MSRDSSAPTVSIVLPTRARVDYLRVALASIAPQAARAGAELIIVDDAGPNEQGCRLAKRFGARYEPHPRPLGLNVARNTGVERSTGELVVFVDDDVEVRDGWLTALLAAARAHPEVEVFTGPIIPRLEGSPPHSCGREGPPITALDLGEEDIRTRYAWGANMAIRRRALQRVGPFDVSLEHGGDEQEWQERLGDGHALYVADAALEHRRSAADARLRPLCRATFARGRAARRFDAWRGCAPTLGRELTTLAGCLGHVLRRRCPAGLTMVAHSSGRTLEAARERTRPRTDSGSPARSPVPCSGAADSTAGTGSHAGVGSASHGRAPDDFLSGESGAVGGLDGVRRAALDIGEDALERVSGRRLWLERAARRSPPTRRVLVLCVARPEHRVLVERIRAELERSRHDVELALAPPGDRGKFENLNLLLAEHSPHDRDWLLAVDDDIVLPHGFLDRFLFLAERFELDLAQPAHRRASHAAWQVTRRRPTSVVRETRFVEIGPVSAFARSTFPTLLPFPDLRMGWGLDAHWAALAREHGWRCGVLDAVAIRHREAPAASAYSREQALTEARAFLAERPYLNASEAQQTLVTHRRW
jgi:GT2 family glycosyltransferase